MLQRKVSFPQQQPSSISQNSHQHLPGQGILPQVQSSISISEKYHYTEETPPETVVKDAFMMAKKKEHIESESELLKEELKLKKKSYPLDFHNFKPKKEMQIPNLLLNSVQSSYSEPIQVQDQNDGMEAQQSSVEEQNSEEMELYESSLENQNSAMEEHSIHSANSLNTTMGKSFISDSDFSFHDRYDDEAIIQQDNGFLAEFQNVFDASVLLGEAEMESQNEPNILEDLWEMEDNVIVNHGFDKSDISQQALEQNTQNKAFLANIDSQK